MLFCRNEKKRKSPYIAMAVTALAIVGAISLTNEGKRLMKNMCCNIKTKMKSMFSCAEEKAECIKEKMNMD